MHKRFNLTVSGIEKHKGEKKNCLAEESARAIIKDIDQTRENYIQRYTGTSRYDARNYDLVLNADGHTEEELADIILSYIQD